MKLIFDLSTEFNIQPAVQQRGIFSFFKAAEPTITIRDLVTAEIKKGCPTIKIARMKVNRSRVVIDWYMDGTQVELTQQFQQLKSFMISSTAFILYHLEEPSDLQFEPVLTAITADPKQPEYQLHPSALPLLLDRTRLAYYASQPINTLYLPYVVDSNGLKFYQSQLICEQADKGMENQAYKTLVHAIYNSIERSNVYRRLNDGDFKSVQLITMVNAGYFLCLDNPPQEIVNINTPRI